MTATSSPLLASSPIVRRIAAIVGWLCVIATLALLSPGVVATARADQAQSAPAAGPVCKAPEQAAEEAALSLGNTIEQLRAQELARGGDPGDFVVLNGRGYNYAPQPNPLQPEPAQR
jgi:hypothetical protein